MALVLLDRAKETTTVVGTGTATLLGAVTSYQSLAGVGNGNTTYYCIVDQVGANWEVGIGTYTSAGTTLARTTVLASSNVGALVNFPAGTKDVFVTYPAEKGVWLDNNGNAIGLGTPASGTLTNCTLPQLSASTGASLVGTTPSGSLSATTVAASLTELDTEKASTAALTSGLALKADTSTVNSQLALKANITDLAASTGSTLIGTIQSGTGATARTVGSKLNDIVSVKDFGAVGDGVTDDTVAIQAAIDYVLSTNAVQGGAGTGGRMAISGSVYLPRGKYKVSSTLHIDENGFELFGDGKDSSVLYRTTNYGHTIKISRDRNVSPSVSNTFYVSICCLSIESLYTIATDSSHIHAEAVLYLDLQNIQFKDGAYRCIDLVGCGNYVVENCRYHQSNSQLYNGYTAPAGSAFIRVRGNNTGATFHTSQTSSGRMNDCMCVTYPSDTQTPFEYSYRIGIADGIWMQNCYGRAALLSDFALVPYDAYSRLSGMRINDCWSDQCKGTCLLIQDTTGGNQPQFDYLISGFTANGDTYAMYGLLIDNPYVCNVTVTNSFFGPTGLEGIYLKNFVKGIRVSDCTTYNCNVDNVSGTPDLRVEPNKQEFTIVNNKLGGLFNTNVQGATDYGIVLGAGCIDFTVSGNHVTKHPTAGILNSAHPAANSFVWGNIGYNQPKNGSAFITAGTASVTVSHGQSVTPAAGEIMITKQGGYQGLTNLRVQSITATTFDITSDTNANINTTIGYSVQLHR